ncbi:MAG: protein kinase, partial [Chloroflexi bacterium]|nr:protein kinase [Chloroflexota bacterium]
IARDGKTAVPLLLSNRHTVQMHPDAAIDLDTSTFDCLVQQVGKSEDLKLLEQAIALYRGDFLFDFYLPDSTPFDEWANARRAAYRRLVLDMLQSLTTLQMQNKWFDRAETAVRRQLSIDPLNDIAHRQLIELLARSGRRTEALAQYDRYCRLLVDELGVEPSAATLVLHQQITSGYFDTTSTNQLRGYELGDEIGHGTFGVVYRAKQPVVARDVAIKIIGPQYTHNPHFTQRFEHEAQLVARLEHPYIVPLYDYWQDANGAYLVMRYLRGGNLEAFLTKGACEIETAVSIIDQIASALATAHKQGIIHRDIKPANILLDEEGNAYLSDFGIAKDLKGDLNLTMDGTIIGSPKYISPEQVRQEPVSPQTDIYSLGIVLYEILTGHPPFMDDSIVDLVSRHLNDPLPSVLARQPALPATIDAIIQQATAKNPTDRFPDMLAFKTAFHNAMAATTPLPQMPPPLPTHPKHNLPAQPTRFVGREQELADLQTWLMNPYSRLITIVGSGGMGKTRLALAAAARHLSAQNARYPDGVFFVPLAALQQPDEIVSKVAQSVNLPMESKTGRSPTQQLLDFLRGKQILLILDNFEHLLDGVTLLADMLSAAPKLQILATSRERLQLYEEQVFAITGLTFPQETAVSTPDTLAEYTAVQLFLDRTQRILPDYRLMKTDATHLARLCQI